LGYSTLPGQMSQSAVLWDILVPETKRTAKGRLTTALSI
jgi:hypothetical protein